jgi:protein-histidine pros-kinase
MKLLIKFNLVLILVFGTGIGIAGYISRNFLERTAREEVLQQARLMMGAAGGMLSYTSQQIVPLLLAHQARIKAFLLQTVPAFSATEVFNYLWSS